MFRVLFVLAVGCWNDWYSKDLTSAEIYYFNFESGESIWDHPCDEYYRNVCCECASSDAMAVVSRRKG